jgi:hypothetical protein
MSICDNRAQAAELVSSSLNCVKFDTADRTHDLLRGNAPLLEPAGPGWRAAGTRNQLAAPLAPDHQISTQRVLHLFGPWLAVGTIDCQWRHNLFEWLICLCLVNPLTNAHLPVPVPPGPRLFQRQGVWLRFSD